MEATDSHFLNDPSYLLQRVARTRSLHHTLTGNSTNPTTILWDYFLMRGSIVG
jgi:hypothetical protein